MSRKLVRRVARLTAITAAAALALSGCAAPSDDGGGSDELVTVRFNIALATAYAPFMVAEKLGYFEEEGIVVEPVRLGEAGATVVTGVLGGALDFAGSAPNGILSAVAQGSDIRAIAIYANGAASNALIATPASGIESPADLVGKKLAFEQGGSLEYLMLELLAAEGVDAESVELIPMRAVDMPAALASGAVDAAIEYEPYVAQLEAEGIVNVISRLDEYKDNQPRFLFTTQRYLDAYPEATEAFVRAMARGQLFIREEGPEATAEIIGEYITEVPLDIQAAAVPSYVWDPRVTEADLVEFAVNTVDFMKDLGNIDPEFDEQQARAAVDTTILDRVLESEPSLLDGLD